MQWLRFSELSLLVFDDRVRGRFCLSREQKISIKGVPILSVVRPWWQGKDGCAFYNTCSVLSTTSLKLLLKVMENR